MPTKYKTDDRGKWQVTTGRDCEVRLLVKPSQDFLDWQASNPAPKPEPVFDVKAEILKLQEANITLMAEIDKLKVKK